jgi:hypothetical protein
MQKFALLNASRVAALAAAGKVVFIFFSQPNFFSRSSSFDTDTFVRL